MEKFEKCQEDCTLDGTVDRHGRPAIRARTGSWFAGILLLVNQGLITLAFYGVGVNLVLFLTRVLGHNNANAANDVSKWTGTVFIFSLLGAFLSDSYLGRYRTCAIFQAIFVIGLASLSLSSYLFLVKPSGCGDEHTPCGSHSTLQISLFYASIYLVALGYGGYQPIIASFGADQFDEEHPKESHSKVAFFSYFYLAFNLGCLFSNTILSYFENKGMWALGFCASAGSAIVGLILFLVGTPRYRHFIPKGNPFSRFCQVIIAASRKWKVNVPSNGDDLYEEQKADDFADNGARKILHSHELSHALFLDRAAVKTPKDHTLEEKTTTTQNAWRLCTVTQVEEVKCILRLLPIGLCTILYSVVFTQMTSLFVEQGAAMETSMAGFDIPPASMSIFNIVAAATFILIHRRILDPIISSLRNSGGNNSWKRLLIPRKLRSKRRINPPEIMSEIHQSLGLTELERMGVALIIAAMSMVSAGVVEHFRLRNAISYGGSSSLSIIWQVPQYVLIGVSEVYMLVGQLEFFNGQAPDGLKSFGSALSMTSISLGNYASSLILTVVMKFSSSDGKSGWIPRNLNKGHLDRFFYLLAALTAADFVVYAVCAKLYKYTRFEERSSRKKNNDVIGVQV